MQFRYVVADIVDPLGQKDEQDPEDGGGDHRGGAPDPDFSGIDRHTRRGM